jgi:cellulose synthase/poly-beta-1,6-N-acetylglucosamine synthase-like glycosyltransferase
MIKSLIAYGWIGLQFVIGYNLIFPMLLYFFYAVFKKKEVLHFSTVTTEADYAIIVTAYEQTSHLPSVVDSLLAINYSNFMIYIVADRCDVSTLSFKDKRVIILRPEEPLMSNVRSHFYAINNFSRAHERLTIIDSDNLVETEYLNQLNIYFDQGYQAVQGPRMPKNLNTTYACLDAARDIYYHFYDGKILFALGSSATLAGSGMAFTTSLYVQCLEQYANLSGAGFDKVLQAEIVKRDIRIAFAEHAIVYDEKTTHSEQLVSQRARWINTWFRYFTYGFSLIKKGLFNFSINQFLFGIILLRPPLFMFLILSVICLFANIFITPFYCLIWLAAFFIFIAGFYIALLRSNTNKQIYKSLAGIPVFMFYQVASLLKIRKVKGNIATRHFHAPVSKN